MVSNTDVCSKGQNLCGGGRDLCNAPYHKGYDDGDCDGVGVYDDVF